eukprot:GHVS01074932.1.p1 GENE.GHVS01074932.1~~GHVS01074932.1.p1  ORF type:complete len:512 (-),score=97.86 GHVS01074932.1:2421-3863(-)
MPHPSQMDASMLGSYANVATRDGLTNRLFWNMIITRAKQIISTFEPKDVALLLNALSRSRRCDPDLFAALVPHVVQHLSVYPASFLVMTVGAYTKNNYHDTQLTTAFLRELQNRLHQFQTAVELSMLLSALTKLNVFDDDLVNRLTAQVICRLNVEVFHIRDLSVIAHALAKLGSSDTQLFQTIAERAGSMLGEATPLELSRLLYAFSRVGLDEPTLFDSSLQLAIDKLVFMSPAELVSTAFAFGQVRQLLLPTHKAAKLDSLFARVRYSSLASLLLFNAEQIAALLQTYARWHICFSEADLVHVLQRVRKMDEKRFTTKDRVSFMYSVGSILNSTAAGRRRTRRDTATTVDNAKDSSARRQEEQEEEIATNPVLVEFRLLMRLWEERLIGELKTNKLSLLTVARMLEGLAHTKSVNSTWLDQIRCSVVWRHKELDAYTSGLFLDTLKVFDNVDEDLLLMLRHATTKQRLPQQENTPPPS